VAPAYDQRDRRRPGRSEARDQPAETAGPGAEQLLIGLQRSAGNHAVTGLLQRAPLTLAEKEQNLSSPRYAGDPVLEAAYDNSPAMHRGAPGHDAVGKVQRGLVDAGYDMPVSMASGAPDGIFGRETDQTVRAFQGDQTLKPDGYVGRQTMGRLDELAGGGGGSKPEIEKTEEAAGQHVAETMERINGRDTYGPDSGVWYDYNYHAAHLKDPANYPWDEKWREGHADPVYWQNSGWMQWRLKPGKSASAAIKAWLTGLTIAECLAAIVVIEIDTMRAALGDAEFDKRYGEEGDTRPEPSRMVVGAGVKGTPLEGHLKRSEAATDPGPYGARNIKIGDWVYFYNHPKYLLKHPGGAWQGENAVYTNDDDAGRQLFTGLGAAGKTEDGMLAEMVGAYRGDRTGDDYVSLLSQYASDAPEVANPEARYMNRDVDYTKSLYEKYIDRIPAIYREDSGEFKDEYSGAEILDDPPYEINGRTRKGGFFAVASSRLDPGTL
jgi:peptidoglycan hydrolase-like protein with peptidoglycan-binding domain